MKGDKKEKSENNKSKLKTDHLSKIKANANDLTDILYDLFKDKDFEGEVDLRKNKEESGSDHS